MPLVLGSRSSSLDPLETKEHSGVRKTPAWRHPAEVEDKPQRGPHEKLWRVRARTIGALRNSGNPELYKRSERMCQCCSTPWIRKTPDNKPALVLGRCRDRLCPLCAVFRGREGSCKVTELIRKMNAPRFLTLTLRESEGSLKSLLDRLFSCFRELRRTKEWKRHVTGGVYSFETTYRADRGTWHPHLHLIIDGEYFPHATIKALWRRVTGDSDVVHIEKVNDAEAQGRYLAQYINTPPELRTWRPATIAEYAEAVHGRRLLHTFGALHGHNPDPAPDDDAFRQSEPLVGVRTLRIRATAGCPHAVEAVDLMRRMGGFWSVFAPPLIRTAHTPFVPFESWEAERLVQLIEASNAAAMAPAPAPPPAPPPLAEDPVLFDFAPPRSTHHI